MEIDHKAALITRQEIFIAAPPEKVWAIQADIERWPEWQPDVKSAKLEGKLAAGTVFRWKAGGVNLVSTLQEVESPRRISWTGVAIGTKAIHTWTFEPKDNGTHVMVEESLSGWFPRIMRVFNPRFLDKAMVASLQVFKAYAEKA